jgi:hypothetical protein
MRERSSSLEGGLLLDPLHMRTRCSSVPMDREDRHQRVSAQLGSSVSGFPFPVSRCQAAPEPEIKTGYSSQATYSNQSTNDLLLQQLMAEMKYLRERVDTLPTGPVQGVATSLQTPKRFRNLVPNLFLLRRKWKSLNKQHCLIPRPLSLLNLCRQAPLRQTYRFPRWCIFVRSSGNTSILRFSPYHRRAPP